MNTLRQIEADAEYRKRNRARANATMKRLANNTAYRKQCIERATAARKAKLQQKGKYWKQDCIAATIRKTKKQQRVKNIVRTTTVEKRKKINAIYATEKDADLRCGQTKKRRPVQYTARQMYWIKRRRKLSHHTLGRQCESVVRATMKVNGRGGNLTLRHPKTP